MLLVYIKSVIEPNFIYQLNPEKLELCGEFSSSVPHTYQAKWNMGVSATLLLVLPNIQTACFECSSCPSTQIQVSLGNSQVLPDHLLLPMDKNKILHCFDQE